MKEQIIHLDTHDDIVSARDKLAWIRAERVLLVFPDNPREPILQERLDLVLLQREAQRRGASLALITRDPVIIEHAGLLDISAFPTVEASHRRHWKEAQRRLSVDRADQPTPLTPELVDAATGTGEPIDLDPEVKRGVTAAIFSATLTIVVASAVLILPGATIRLDPAANEVSVTTTVTAQLDAESVDPVEGIVPGRSVGVELEDSITVDTTGTTSIPSERARGVALFSNQLPEQVTIPAGTIVHTSAAEPVRFQTLSDVTLPGGVGETVEVAIEAVEPGFTGNIPRARINQIEGPLATRLAVTNSEATRGGDVIDVPAVAQEDRDRARALLMQLLQQRGFAELQTDPQIGLRETEFIPLDTLNIVLIYTEVYDAAADQPAETLTLTMRGVVQGVAIDERLARQVVYAQLAERVDTGFQLAPDSLIYRRGEVTDVSEERAVTFIMQGAGSISAVINDHSISRAVAATSRQRAQIVLSRELPLATAPEIQMWPDFWPLMPVLPIRIEVESS
ncbi:MAG: baseplate J/gp47 family protein [Anaerolineae bacterium]